MHFTSILYAGLLLLQIVTMNMLFSTYARDYRNEFEEKRLQIVVNYATDGAAKEMRDESSHLNQDYVALSRLNVDPKVAMDTFATIFGKNYRLPINNVNIQNLMTEYCPVFMVASYDGYYIADRRIINSSGVQNLIFTPKLPYLDNVPDYAGHSRWYSYNLSGDNAIMVDDHGGIYNVYRERGQIPKTKSEILYIINQKLSDALNAKIQEYAATDPKGMIYVPSEMTVVHATNRIEYTTVFAYIDNFDIVSYGNVMQCFGIGASDISLRKVVAAFQKVVDGELHNFYAYSDELPQGVHVIATYATQQEAASHGYYYYMD